MKHTPFRLRFYSQTTANVEACVEELKAANPLILGHVDSPERTGMNIGLAPSHVVDLLFGSEADARSMMGNTVTRDIYMRYANGTTHPGSFSEREVGMKTNKFA